MRELKRGATGWVETARATRDVGRPPTGRERDEPELPGAAVSVCVRRWLWRRRGAGVRRGSGVR